MLNGRCERQILVAPPAVVPLSDGDAEKCLSVWVCFVAGTECCPCRREKKKVLIPHILSNNQCTVEQLSQSKHIFSLRGNEDAVWQCTLHTRSHTNLSQPKVTSYYRANIYIKAICLEPLERLLVADTRLFLESRIILWITWRWCAVLDQYPLNKN